MKKLTLKLLAVAAFVLMVWLGSQPDSCALPEHNPGELEFLASFVVFVVLGYQSVKAEIGTMDDVRW